MKIKLKKINKLLGLFGFKMMVGILTDFEGHAYSGESEILICRLKGLSKYPMQREYK